MPLTVTQIEDPAERSRICREILRELPGWFGLPESNERYERKVAELPTFAVGEDAFLSLKLHSASSAELYLMGVRQELHGQGLGTALVAAAEDFLLDRGIEFVHVKTLGPSHPSERYERTRRFYEGRGFIPLEELHGVWDENNPCLVLVKHLSCR
jgi:GNAT superfamily N-acetyltransferase